MKKAVADSIVNALKPMQEKYYDIIQTKLVDEVLDKGRERANKIASEKYDMVRKLVGFGR